MMQDGEITRAEASEFAHMVMHDNAAKLYGLSTSNRERRIHHWRHGGHGGILFFRIYGRLSDGS